MNSSNYYTTTGIDDLDNELQTLCLNAYNKHEIDTCFTYYYNIEYLNTHVDLKTTNLNTYTTSEVDNIIHIIDSTSMLSIINNNSTNIMCIYIYID